MSPSNPASKNFYCIFSIHIKNHLYIVNCQFKLAVIFAILFVFGWLVDNQLVAAHTKSQKFLKLLGYIIFYSILFKKI